MKVFSIIAMALVAHTVAMPTGPGRSVASTVQPYDGTKRAAQEDPGEIKADYRRRDDDDDIGDIKADYRRDEDPGDIKADYRRDEGTDEDVGDIKADY